MVDLTDLRLGDTVETRKQHPCGNRTWTVVRLGADIGLVCQKCGHKVLMPRQKLARAARTVTHADAPTERTDATGEPIPTSP